jgi:hypothetical protein
MLVAGTTSSTRGQYININAGESDAFDIGIIQATMKFPISAFSTSDVLLFEVVKEDTTAVQFYIDSINTANNRARIFAKDDAGSSYTTVEYFINGIKTEYPVVSLDQWVTLGIRFTEHFNIASQTATIKICGPMLLNSLFYSQLKAGDEASSILTISRWTDILYEEKIATITAVNDAYPSSGTVEYTANNSFSIGDVVTISGFSISGFNGTFTVTAATATYFRVANATTGTPTLTNAQAEAYIRQIWNSYSASTWGTELVTTASATEINGLEIQDVYESFTGTQKIIAAYDATDTKLKTKSYQYVAYIGSTSDTITSSLL